MSTQGNNDIASLQEDTGRLNNPESLLAGTSRSGNSGTLAGTDRPDNSSAKLSPLASLIADLFGKPSKTEDKARQDGDKTKAAEQARQAEERAKQDKAKQEKLALEQARSLKEQTDSMLLNQARLMHQAALETRASLLKDLIGTIIPSLQLRETQQPVPQIQELGKAPPEAHIAYAAKLAGEVCALKDLATAHAWQAFNGNDALSKPTDNFPADDRIATLGRELVEMKSLINFTQPFKDLPKMEWTKDIRSITDNNGALTMQQTRILQPIIEQKVEFLQSILRDPVAVQMVRDCKDLNALDKFLVEKAPPFHVPAESMVRNQSSLANAQAVSFAQKASIDFPGNDSVSALGRQISQAQSYLNIGKINEAKAFLDPVKVGAFAEWLKPLATATAAEQKVILQDNFEALKQITKTATGQSLPVQIISTKFLDLMQESIASSRTSTSSTTPQSLETEAARQAVLYICQNPNVINHVLNGTPEVQKISAAQQEITRVAITLAQKLIDTNQGAKLPDNLQQVIEQNVKQITFPTTAPNVISLSSQPNQHIQTASPRIENLPASVSANRASSAVSQRMEHLSPVPELTKAQPALAPIRAQIESPVPTTAPQVIPQLINLAKAETTTTPTIPTGTPVESSTPISTPQVMPQLTALAKAEATATPADPTGTPVESISAATSPQAIPQLTELAKTENITPVRASIEPGAPAAALPEIPQFSMSILNNLINNVAHPGETWLQSSVVNFVPVAHLASDLAKHTPLLTISLVDNMSDVPNAANISLTDSMNSVVRNNDLLVSYNQINIPNPFQVQAIETVLTGRGSNLDGANRGPNAIGSSGGRSNNARISNSSLLSTWSPSSASSNWTASSGGAIFGSSTGSNSNTNLSANGSSLGAGGKSSSSGGGGGGFLWAYRPSWHHGFLNGLRSGFAINGMNPWGLNKDKDKDKDKDPDKDPDEDENTNDYNNDSPRDDFYADQPNKKRNNSQRSMYG